jgi:ABC-type nitrate/sulfonate/bicarbonate transport system permease component
MAAPGVAPARTSGEILSARRLQALAVIAFLGTWELASASGAFYRGAIPSVFAVGEALVVLLNRSEFWSNFAITLFEIVAALAIGSVAGILVGMIVGSSRYLAKVLEPPINWIASTPKVIFLPIFYLVFGLGVGSKIAASALGSFFPIAIGVIAGMLGMSPVLVRVGRSFGLSWWQMTRKIYLPSLVPPILSGLRIAVGIAIGVCLIAETRFSFAGLGFMVFDAFNRARFAEVYAVLVIIVALSVVANSFFGRLAARSAQHSSNGL